jgi:glycosyltransferase involved in cell wall biosynthesis
MKFSIITPSFNQGKYIQKTITSVLTQGYSDVEHIVVDGGSTDETVDILKSYQHVRWVSEPDAGLSDALNKGLAMCTGDVVGWLNSDDYYFDDTVLQVAAELMRASNDWVTGGTSKLRDGQIVLNPYKKISKRSVFTNCDYLRTPASFYKTEALREVGGFDNDLHQAMDYDLYVRLFKRGYVTENTEKTFTVFRIHDDQKTHPSNLLDQYREILRINARNGLHVSSLRKSLKFMYQWLYFRIIRK